LIQFDLELYTMIATRATRRAGAKELARRLDAADLIIFDFDDEIGRFLPSIGFAQTIPGGRDWRKFLQDCEKSGEAFASLLFPGESVPTQMAAKKFTSNSIWVIQNGNNESFRSESTLRLVALNLAAVFKNERQAKKFEGQNTVLSEMTRDLRVYSDSLNRTKSDLNEALKEAGSAKLAAEAASSLKSAFLANMSHEIRTPLGAILGFCEFLKEPNLALNERSHYIDTIVRNGQALTRIIDDILDLAKVEAGRMEVEDVDFAFFDLVTEVIDLFKEKAKQKSLYLILSFDDFVPSHIGSDPTRIRQILINIVGNAIKFTLHGGVRIHVRSIANPEGPLKISIDVKDTGPGLTDEQTARLFQPFMQADNTTTRSHGGTGLGLTLSRRLAEALGGNVVITDSKPGAGSTFTLSFLASPTASDSHAVPLQRQPFSSTEKALRLEGVRVLLADDSPDNQFLINRLLAKNGAIVEIASDGREAVEKALAAPHDVVLMDIQMPHMDGYQATEALLAQNFRTPILALTAHAMIEERRKTKAAGFAGHLTKPLNMAELIDSVADFAKLTTRS
jgi:signal transduction histidine kinase/CheY-like chemotaxis protein